MTHSQLQLFASVCNEFPIVISQSPLKYIQFDLWFFIPTGLVNLPNSVSSEIL